MATQQAEQPLQSTTRRESRALGPGSRAPRAGLAATLAIALLVVGAAALNGASSGQTPHHRPAAQPAAAARAASRRSQTVDSTRHPVKTSGNTYGYVPAWLGSSKVPVGRVVTATPTHPWLAVQGDTVRVKLPAAQVLATVVGPAVPAQGRYPIPQTTPCSFTVTLTAAAAPIAIVPRQFTTTDEQGGLHTLRVTSLNGSPPPRQVTPGTTVELKMSAVLPTGQGRLIWAPLAASRPLVQWDFDVEVD